MKTKYFNGKMLLKNNFEMEKIIEYFKKGKIIAFPTETVYGLGANVFDQKAICEIYKVKARPNDNPLILHIGRIEQLRNIIENISKKTMLLIKYFWPGPLTLILKCNKNIVFPKEVNINGNIAIRMPNHLVTETLLSQGNLILAAPSANISGKPSPTEANHVKDDLNNKIYGIIDGGRCDLGIESTIISLVNENKPILLRPGTITKKMIENVIEEKIAIDSFIKLKNKFIVPGMKYQHYSPRGKIYIFFSLKQIQKIQKVINLKKINLKKIALLIFNEEYENYKNLKIDNCFCIGSKYNLKEIIYNFYSILRKCDKLNIELIFAQGVKESGLGFSFMNRLKKAANYNYLDCDKEIK